MDVVKKIILINLAVYGICDIFSIFFGLHLENLFALYPVNSDYFSFYQLITHLFIHADPEHLFFNMVFFLISGPDVEKYFGNKFLSFYLLSGVFSSGLYCLGSNTGIIGASGAVFATITASVLISIKNKDYKSINSKWVLKFRSLFFIFFILSEFYTATFYTNDNVGHWAHIFGVFFAIGYYFINSARR
jgi:membrane associated rhomboid family serine protease